MGNRVSKDDQIRLIMECRRSGLSDYQWCELNGIYPGNFYNWVSKLRKSGYTIPESEAKKNALPNVQEVVKLDLIPEPEPAPIQMIEQNVSQSIREPVPSVAAEVLIGNLTLRLFNGADEQLIQNTLKSIGGLHNAW